MRSPLRPSGKVRSPLKGAAADRPPATAWIGRGPLLAGLLVVLLLASSAGMMWLVQNPPADAPGGGVSIGGPFTLTDGAGQTVTDRTWRGKYLLVYFGYTFCPDVCPTTLNDVAQALDRLGKRADALQPLFITVDPGRDTPEVVRQYAGAFTPRLVGLTGTAEQIRTVAREYRVYYAEHRTGPGAGDYTMDHSSLLYLMGPDGAFVAPIRADAGAEAIAADLARRLPAG